MNNNLSISNGGCVVAMCGKNCVAIAADHRFGAGAHTISTDFKKIFKLAPHLCLGMTGLHTDVLTVHNRMMYRKNVFEIREEEDITSKTFVDLLSLLLYEHRFAPFFVESVIVGLDKISMEPYICSVDILGSANEAKDFVVAGTSSTQLYGICESLWSPNLDPNQLFEVLSQSLVRAIERDAMSGWGATVLVLECDKVTERTIKTRMD